MVQRYAIDASELQSFEKQHSSPEISKQKRNLYES